MPLISDAGFKIMGVVLILTDEFIFSQVASFSTISNFKIFRLGIKDTLDCITIPQFVMSVGSKIVFIDGR